MELEFWIAIVLDVLAAVGLVYLARSRKAQPPLLKALTLALGLLFIFFTAANCANVVHSPLIPSLVGLALSSAASCLALTGAPEGRGDE